MMDNLKNVKDEPKQDLITCSGCGKQIPSGSKFCPECGKAQSVNKFCPECGAKVAPNAKFCNECGTKLN